MDLYGACHPRPGEDCIDAVKLGHTYFTRIGSSSRIDLILVNPAVDPALVTCHVDNSFQLGGSNDHRPVIFSVPLDSPVAVAVDQRWYPDRVRVAHLDGPSKSFLAQSLQESARSASERWSEELSKVTAETPGMEVVMESAARAFSSALWDPAFAVAGQRGPPVVKPYHPPLSLKKARARLKSLHTLADSITRGLASPSGPSLYSPVAASAVRQLKVDGWSSDLVPVVNMPWSRKDLWSEWLEYAFPNAIAAAKEGVRVAIRDSSLHPANETRLLFQTPEGRGLAYSKHFSDGSAGPTVQSARGPDGMVLTDPLDYMPVVRDTVALPFSNPKPGPAVPAWRATSEEERSTGVPDWWWSTYKWNAANVPAGTWDGLMAPTSREELIKHVEDLAGGKTPGHDGISTDLLKLAILLEDYPSCTDAILEFVNATLRTGYVPPHLKKGVIVMVPKPGGSGDVDDMRPITLLPEIGKLTSRILAARFAAALHSHKDVMDPAQRAHLHDGNTHQCLHVLFDVAEDFQDRKRTEPDHELVITAYDVRKAFDSVQLYSIKAALSRYGVPEAFARFIISSMQEATSVVRTLHGLTESFDILTSVRQGDPIAALVFNLLMDSLHAGLRENPFRSGSEKCGYSFSPLDGGYEVFTSGFSDDTLLLSDSWAGAVLQHRFLLDFFTAHRMGINASKTHCVIASGTGVGWRYLPNAEETRIHDPLGGAPLSKQALDQWTDPHPRYVIPVRGPIRIIPARGPSHVFRYLGYAFCADLDPTAMFKQISKQVWKFCKKIDHLNLNLVQAGQALSECLLPKLRTGLSFANLSSAQYKELDKIIRRYTLRSRYGVSVASLCREAGHAALGTYPLADHASLLRITEFGAAVRSTHAQCERTCLARVSSAVRLGFLSADLDDATPDDGRILLLPVVKHAASRVSLIVELAYGLGIRVTCPVVFNPTKPMLPQSPLPSSLGDRLFNVVVGCPLLPTPLWSGLHLICPPSPECPDLVAFTDGSSISWCSAYAFAICRADLCVEGFSPSPSNCVLSSGQSPTAGRNYVAEAIAILGVIMSVPVNANLTIYTDALSVKDVMDAPLIAEGRRLRLGGRPVICTLRQALCVREKWGAKTGFIHVLSHTEELSVGAIGNAYVDHEASRACLAALAAKRVCDPFLANEETAVFWDVTPKGDLSHIAGDIKGVIKSALDLRLVRGWRDHSSQGAVARECGGLSTLNRVREIRRSLDPGALMFMILTVTCQLPTADKVIFGEDRTDAALLCPVCKAHPQSTEHTFTCSGSRPGMDRMKSCVEGHLWGLIQPALASTRVSPVHKATLSGCIPLLAFFDPGRPPSDPFFSSDAEVQAEFSGFDESNRLGGVLGILPRGLEEALLPSPTSLGASERHHRSMRKDAAARWGALRDDIFRLAKSTYESWAWSVLRESRCLPD